MPGKIQRLITIAAIVCCGLLALPGQALAWGDEGHEIVALIAEHFLEPAVKAKIDAMLAADTDDLTRHDIASEATWADKYRESDRRTGKWHYVDIELDHPDIDAACYGHPALPAGMTAFQGPADDCVIDKIDAFAAELESPGTSAEERLDALKFLLHFVGDLHQPLHAGDNHDAGGNRVRVTAEGFRRGNLHHFWDTEFVERLGPDPKAVAAELIARITPAQQRDWSKGTPADWANEAFALARDHAYGKLGSPTDRDSYQLSPDYIEDATSVVRLQLSRAGVRLAAVLNRMPAAPASNR
jgi:hypothetical protein